MKGSFWNFGVAIALFFWRYKIKYRFISNHLFKESKKMAVEKNLRVTINFMKMFSIYPVE